MRDQAGQGGGSLGNLSLCHSKLVKNTYSVKCLNKGSYVWRKRPGGASLVAVQGRPLLQCLYLRSNLSEHPPQGVGAVKNLGSCKKIG